MAYFLTWTTYGSWLPGDERGWTKRKKGARLPDPERKSAAAKRMCEAPCVLDGDQRGIVESTVARHCGLRGWALHAINCRTNHVHVVLTAARMHPDDVRDQLKAWCTRKLRELEVARIGPRLNLLRKRWWTEKGSSRFINDEDSLEAAVTYVHDRQDRVR
ncbi:MAG: hypothetical protein AB7U76_08670 [Pirellulales bacterium]